jgi:predicted RNA-binding protein with PUA-like domain
MPAKLATAAAKKAAGHVAAGAAGAAAPPRQYFLMKTEPNEFSINDLERESAANPAQCSTWDGVRNYQARNLMRSMRLGDVALIYHSNVPTPGIVGLGTICATAFPDPSQHDAKSKYYDAASPADAPRWSAVRVQFSRRLARIVTLDELRALWSCDDSPAVRPGNRLSVCPVAPAAALEAIKAATKIAGKRRPRDE